MIGILLPITVALVGSFNQADLSRWVGNQYQFQEAQTIAQASGLKPSVLLINSLPKAESWLRIRDSFVPQLEREISSFKATNPQARVFVLLPPSSADFSKDTLEQEVVPLLRQAAEESSVGSIEFQPDTRESEQIAEAIIDYAAQKANWKLVGADSEEGDEGPAANAIDGNTATYWHTRYSPKSDPYPHQLVVDMGTVGNISGFRYLPRQDGGTNGRIKKFEFYVSSDGTNWGSPVAQGAFPNKPSATAIHFPKPVPARYFKFVAISEQNNGPWASAAEIDVLPAP
jgi:hypothetical protein